MSPARRPAAIGFALLAAAILATGSTVPARGQSSSQDLVDAACSMPARYVQRIWRGWRPDRGAELIFIAEEPNFVGTGLPHVGPYDYIEHVPMFWYGPGFIKAQGEVSRPVSLAGIAPTTAELLYFDGFHAPDGQPMTEALLPAQERPVPPKLIVTMVWDAGGMNVLENHPDAWPNLEALIPKGTFYDQAYVGSTPTSTAQMHAIIGTGAFPRHHGIVGHQMLVGGQVVGTPWAKGPAFFILPTLGDLYDVAMDNEPVVGIVATVDIHFGMMGHGSFFGGGDRDIALTRSVVNPTTITDEGFEWNLPPRSADYYELAGYANQVPGFDKDVRQLDQADGKLDGYWRDNNIAEYLQGFDTPARIPYQERVIEQVIRREGFGADDVPDLLFINHKQIDYISHIQGVGSPEMNDTVVAQDLALRRFVRFLDREVGEGEWALVLTADHAAMPPPELTGAYQISTGPMKSLIEKKFDKDNDRTPIVELMQPTQAFLNMDELAESGATVEDVARYMLTFTQSMTAAAGIEPQPGRENDTVFQAAFPGELLNQLPCLQES